RLEIRTKKEIVGGARCATVVQARQLQRVGDARLAVAESHRGHRFFCVRSSTRRSGGSEGIGYRMLEQDVRFDAALGLNAGRDRSPRDPADTRTLLHRVAGATPEQIHSGRIRPLLPSSAVVFTGTSGRIVEKREVELKLATKQVQFLVSP